MDIVFYSGSLPFLALLGLTLIVSFFDTQQTNSNFSGQPHMYVAHVCVTGHIHSIGTGRLPK